MKSPTLLFRAFLFLALVIAHAGCSSAPDLDGDASAPEVSEDAEEETVAAPESSQPAEPPAEPPVEKNVAVEYLEKLGPIVGKFEDESVRRVYRALRADREMKFRPSRKTNSPYRKLFGTNDLSAAREFVEARVKGWTFDAERIADFPGAGGTFATNLGPLAWLKAVASAKAKKKIEAALEASTDRLKEGFFYVAPVEYPHSVYVVRARRILDFATLAHEARHGDCAKAPTKKFVRRELRSGEPSAKFGAKTRCFQTHVRCKFKVPGNPPICDPDFSGSLALGYAVTEEMVARCRTCDPLGNAFARHFALAALRQVNALPPKLRKRIDANERDLGRVMSRAGSPSTARALKRFFVDQAAIVKDANALLLKRKEFRLER